MNNFALTTVTELVLYKIILSKSDFLQLRHFAQCHLCHFGDCTVMSKYLWLIADDGHILSI